MKLITIPISHYCEKARWALDRFGIAFEERRHLQMFHYPWAWAAAGTPMVPVLIDGQTTIADSTAILQYLDRTADPSLRLYPADAASRADVDRLEHDFDERLGVETRRWMYLELMRDGDVDLSFMAHEVPAIERWALPFAIPIGRRFIRWRLDVTDTHVARGRAVIDATLDAVESRLSDGRRFLCGDAFTAADLTFACMSAPMVLPPNYGTVLPAMEDLPPRVSSVLLEYQHRPAVQFARRMFAEHR